MSGGSIPHLRGDRPKREFSNAPVACAVGQAGGCQTWCCRRTLVIVAQEDVDDGIALEPGFLDLMRRKDDMSCWHLADDGRCTVWEQRPLDCRLFSCEGRQEPEPLGGTDWGADERREDRLPCVRCGSEKGYIARFLGETGRMRCSACGSGFMPLFFAAQRLLLHPDPTPMTDAERHAQLGETREYLGELETAASAYLSATRLEPEVVEHWLGLARVASARGDHEVAEEAFLQAEAFAPERAWLGRGLAREDGEAFRRAAELGSDSPWAQWGLGRAAMRDGDLPEAIRRLEWAAAGSDCDRRVMQSLIDLALGGHDDARAAIERLGDRRAGAAIGARRPWLDPEDARPSE